MDHKTLTCKEICSIIDKCAKNGVARIIFSGLELEFQKTTEKSEQFNENTEEERAIPLQPLKKTPKEEFEMLVEESKYLDPELYERLKDLDENLQDI